MSPCLLIRGDADPHSRVEYDPKKLLKAFKKVCHSLLYLIFGLSNRCRSLLAMVILLTMRKWAKSSSFKEIRGSKSRTSSSRRVSRGAPSSCMGFKRGVGQSVGGAVWSQFHFLLSILRVILFCPSYELAFHPYWQCINTSTLVVDTNGPDRYV